MALDEFLAMEKSPVAEIKTPEVKKAPETPKVDELPLFAGEPEKKIDNKPEQLSFGF